MHLSLPGGGGVQQEALRPGRPAGESPQGPAQRRVSALGSPVCACCVACLGACQTLSESSFQDPEASEPAEAGDFKGKVVESKSTKEGPVNMFLLLEIFNLRLFLSLQRSHSCQVCEEADDNSGGISIHNIGG